MSLHSELATRADQFNQFWQHYFTGDKPKNLYNAAGHLPRAGGKRLKPFLAMVACESVFGEVTQVMPFAASVELVHNFTLVHDDIMDKSHLRRNIPTVHIKYSEPTAILAGDFLFAKAFEALHELSVSPAVFKELHQGLIDCVLEICRGQQLDMEFEQKHMIIEQEYLEMIQKKTAALFRLAARGGAVIGGGNKKQNESLAQYGTSLGLAFQIWDDYLDLSSDEQTLGKTIGNDIRNGKKTLIAVHALEHAAGSDKKTLLNVFGNSTASETDIKHILHLFKQLKSVEYARDTALHYNQKAKKAVHVLEDSAAKTTLKDLADFAIQREK